MSSETPTPKDSPRVDPPSVVPSLAPLGDQDKEPVTSGVFSIRMAPDVPVWLPWAAGGVSAVLTSIGTALSASVLPALNTGSQIPVAGIVGLILVGLGSGAGVIAGVTSPGRPRRPRRG